MVLNLASSLVTTPDLSLLLAQASSLELFLFHTHCVYRCDLLVLLVRFGRAESCSWECFWKYILILPFWSLVEPPLFCSLTLSAETCSKVCFLASSTISLTRPPISLSIYQRLVLNWCHCLWISTSVFYDHPTPLACPFKHARQTEPLLPFLIISSSSQSYAPRR